MYNLKIAETNKTIGEETFRQTKHSLSARIESALNGFIDAAQNIRVREKYLAASEEQSRITSEKYINGLESYYNWYSVEENFINSQNALLAAKKDAALAEANLKNVLGWVE